MVNYGEGGSTIAGAGAIDAEIEGAPVEDTISTFLIDLELYSLLTNNFLGFFFLSVP